MNPIESWISSLCALQQLAAGRDPKRIGGGEVCTGEDELVDFWLKREGIEDYEQLEAELSAAVKFDGESPASLAWQIGRSVYLAGFRRIIQMNHPSVSDYFKWSLQAARVAQSRFSSWEDYLRAHLAGAKLNMAEESYEQIAPMLAKALASDGPFENLPWDTEIPEAQPFTCLRLTMRQLCSGCGRMTLIARMGESFQCQHCLASLTSESAVSLLDAPAEAGRHSVVGMLARSLSHAGTLVRYEAIHPTCRKCQTELKLTELQKPKCTSLSCPKCETKHSVRVLDSSTQKALLGFRWIVGESPAQPKAPNTEDLVLGCDHCGSTLRTQPTRGWSCEYCQGVTELSDSVWELVHPPPPLGTHYLIAEND